MNRTVRFFLMLIVFISTFSIAQAQKPERKRSPEQMANRTTTAMADSLALSDAQKEKIAEVNLKYANKMMEARTEARKNADGDRSTVRMVMTELRNEQNAELKKYLTSEQYTKWEKIQANRQDRRRGDRRRGSKGDRERKQKEKQHKEQNKSN